MPRHEGGPSIPSPHMAAVCLIFHMHGPSIANYWKNCVRVTSITLPVRHLVVLKEANFVKFCEILLVGNLVNGAYLSFSRIRCKAVD